MYRKETCAHNPGHRNDGQTTLGPAAARRRLDVRPGSPQDQVGLGHLTPDLDKVDNWPQRLSGGEQQRLAVARVLLAEPATIFLDEATAALDEAGEALLYGLLRNLPWRPTIISVGHRGTLHAFHDRSIDLGTMGTAAAAPAA